ncbi:MAG TPA: sugar porter family MFS transporter [Ktedonobacterales bacterium]|jgi:sugar porter (SP) family MFS transporter
MTVSRSPIPPYEPEQGQQQQAPNQPEVEAMGLQQALPQQALPQQAPPQPPPHKLSPSTYIYLIGGVGALGGLLFGYDTGVISGAQGLLQQSFHLTPTTQEIAVSSVLIGTIIGAAIGGKLADWLGRKKALIVMAIIFAAGAILTAISPELISFMVFRALTGVAIGGASVQAPMYITESAPASKRGGLVFLFQLAITIGILVAYGLDFWFATWLGNWRPMFAIAVIPAAILGIGMFFMTDTPRWLASKGRWEEAHEAMSLTAGPNATQEMALIRERMELETHTSWKELFRKGVRLALLAAVGLAVFQQFVGINTIIYYAPIVAGYSGFGGSGGSASLFAAVIVGIVNVLATVLAIFLVDRAGRRPLLLIGTTGLVLTLTGIGITFILGPEQWGNLMFALILLYIVSFAVGLGPVFWLMSAELFPNRLRGSGESIATFGNWTSNLLVTITFLTMINTIGKPLTFWVYAACGVVTLFFIWFLIPETKNKPLEHIEQYWEQGRVWPPETQVA